jgi:hypothetical protein
VLTAIEFDNKASVVASKIDNITSEWHLPAELMPVNLTRSQDLPDAPLGLGHIPA